MMRNRVKNRNNRHEDSDAKEKEVILPVASAAVGALLATALLHMSSYMQIACTSMKSYKQYQVSVWLQH